MENYDFGFFAASPLDQLACVAAFCRPSGPLQGAEAEESDPGLYSFVVPFLASNGWDCPLGLFISERKGVGSWITGGVLTNTTPETAGTESVLQALLAVAEAARCEYLVAGDEDLLGVWSGDVPLCPHLFGLYDERVAATRAFAEAVSAAAEWFSAERRGAFTCVVWRGGLVAVPNAADATRFKDAFRPLYEAWDTRR